MSEQGSVVEKAAGADAGAVAAAAAAEAAKANGADKGADKSAADKGSDKAAAADVSKAEGPAWTPETWREYLAGDDPAELARLKRFKDPKGLVQKLNNQEKIISARATKTKPAEGATPEELAAWRTEMGLPPEPKGFLEALKLPDGRVLGDDDTPVAERFAAAIHKADPTPTGIFSAIVGEYFNQVEEATVAQQEADVDSKIECHVALQKTFGSKRAVENEFKHIGLALFDDMPDGLAERIYGARYPDGKLLGNDPEFIGLLSAAARKAASIEEPMPSGRGADASSRREEIRAMRDSPDPNVREKYMSPAIQAEELALIDAELNAKNRGRRAA